jgi:hypothetical protein
MTAPTLYVTRIVKPNEADELTPLEQEQLRIGVRGYDEQDLPASERFDDDPSSETTVRGNLEIRSISDEAGQPQFDLFSYLSDGGVIFRAGTTDEIGWLSQGQHVVLKEPDPALRDELQRALGPTARLRT